MRRSIKKAVAFTLAAVTMFANLSVTAPVKAAEYGEVKEVLAPEYDYGMQVGENTLFTKEVDLSTKKDGSDVYLEKVVIVDKDGQKSTVELKDENGKYKYRGVSYVSDDYVAMYRDDGTYALYDGKGYWFGEKAKYSEIVPISDGNFIAVTDGVCNIVDKTGKVIGNKLFSVEGYVSWEYISKFNDYTVIGIETYKNDDWVVDLKVFDKDYKEVKNSGFAGCKAMVLSEELLAVYTDKEVHFYDSKLNKLDAIYKNSIVKNPSVSADQESVLVDYTIYGIGEIYTDDKGQSKFIVHMDVAYTDRDGYDYAMIDAKTLKEVEEEDSDDFQYYEYEISNSELTYVYKEGKESFYYGAKKVADEDSIEAYIKKINPEASEVYLYDMVGSAGDVYIELYVDVKEGHSYATLVLEKSSGYDIEKAKVINKEMVDYDSQIGYILFSDETKLINGKEYDKNTYIEIKYQYDSEGRYYTRYYVIESKTNDKTTYTLYDKNHDKICTSQYRIEAVSKNGQIIVVKEVEKDGYLYWYYGCYYFKKTLVNSQDILDELETAEEGETIEVEIKKNDPIKAEVFETIKGKDVNVVLNLENGMSWKINGKNVKGDKLTDINLTVDVVKDVVPAAAIDKVNLKGDRIELSLAHNGEFGFSAELTMNVKKENAGKFANRFYYNPETKELEFQEAVKIDTNGDATFTYTHASDYVIILSDVSYETMAGKPGDMANVGILVALLGTAGAAMFVFQKKRDLVK